jgi:serine O-acetyltransferase
MRKLAGELLEKLYCCQIICEQIDKSVRFAHHARGCTIIAAKICENVIIYQNVTIGTNLRFNKIDSEWENIGNPIISRNVAICDGAKILGPIMIGENCVVAAGAIITKDVPANSIAYGANRFRMKDPNYEFGFSADRVGHEKIMEANRYLIEKYKKTKA